MNYLPQPTQQFPQQSEPGYSEYNQNINQFSATNEIAQFNQTNGYPFQQIQQPVIFQPTTFQQFPMAVQQPNQLQQHEFSQQPLYQQQSSHQSSSYQQQVYVQQSPSQVHQPVPAKSSSKSSKSSSDKKRKSRRKSRPLVPKFGESSSKKKSDWNSETDHLNRHDRKQRKIEREKAPVNSQRIPSHHKSSFTPTDDGREINTEDVTVQDKRKSGFLCRMKFRTRLHGPPLGPKMLRYPFSDYFMTKYSAAPLELSREHDTFADPETAIPIDIVDPEAYVPEPGKMSNEDKNLVYAELQANSTFEDEHARRVSSFSYRSANFLRFGSIMSPYELRRKQTSSEKFSYTIPIIKEPVTSGTEEQFLDQEEQLALIECEFDDVIEICKTLKHPKRNPNASIVSHVPVYFNLNLDEKTKFSRLVFDRNPAEQVRRMNFVKNKTYDPILEKERNHSLESKSVNKSAWELLVEGSLLKDHGSSFLLYVINDEEGDVDRNDYVAEFARQSKNKKIQHSRKYFLMAGSEESVEFGRFSDELVLRTLPIALDEDSLAKMKSFPASIDLDMGV